MIMNKNYKTSELIITIILSVFVTFFGVRTFYIVFLLKAPVQEKVVEKTEISFDITNELLKNIPHNYLNETVYKEMSVSIEDLDIDYLIKYIILQDINSLRIAEVVDEDVVIEEDETYFVVPSDYIKIKFEELFDLKYQFLELKDDDLFRSVQENENYHIFVKLDKIKSIDKKSILVSGYEENNMVYVTEKVLFIDQLKVEEVDSVKIFNIGILKQFPESADGINDVLISSQVEDYGNLLFSIHGNYSKQYEHKFEKKNDKYYWKSARLIN